MKNMRLIFILTTILVALSTVCLAGDPDDTMGSQMGGGMMNRPDKGCSMMSMHSMMGMMSSIVATSDGGVVVMIGNKLYKYDKNLNLVKETEIKLDMKGMQRMMKHGGTSQNKGNADNPATPEEETGQEQQDQQ
jgi:hypothetical protein